MIYKNTFEIFGDPSPCEAESKRDYAKACLGLFKKNTKGEYIIEGMTSKTGMSNEIRWVERVLEDCHEVTEADDYFPETGLISEELLLDYLEEAVEAVEAVITPEQALRDMIALDREMGLY